MKIKIKTKFKTCLFAILVFVALPILVFNVLLRLDESFKLSEFDLAFDRVFTVEGLFFRVFRFDFGGILKRF